jgi:hypothetical protein
LLPIYEFSCPNLRQPKFLIKLFGGFFVFDHSRTHEHRNDKSRYFDFQDEMFDRAGVNLAKEKELTLGTKRQSGWIEYRSQKN